MGRTAQKPPVKNGFSAPATVSFLAFGGRSYETLEPMAPQNAATDNNMRQNRPLGARWKAASYQEACEQKSRTDTES